MYLAIFGKKPTFKKPLFKHGNLNSKTSICKRCLEHVSFIASGFLEWLESYLIFWEEQSGDVSIGTQELNIRIVGGIEMKEKSI